MPGKMYLSAGALLVAANLAVATPIAVPNFSFENPAAPDNGSVDVSGTTIPGSWTSTLFVHVDNPVADGVGNVGQGWTTPVPDGDQVLHMLASGNPYNVQSDQKIPNTFVAGETYTITVAIGNSFEQDVPQHYALRIFGINGAFSDYMLLKTHLTDPVPNGEWRDVTGTYTVKPNDPLIGDGFIDVNLTNGLGYDTTNGQDEIYFDNVRIDVVPEPALASLAGAGLGALALGRRRR